MQNPRVPVVGKDGKPRMPTKASRARRWIKQGKATPKWNKLGIFYVQLTADVGEETQDVVLGLDPGSKSDGVAVVSKRSIDSHAMDALVIAADEIGLKKLKAPSFFVWKRYQYPRRQIHKFQFEKGGIRRREGGSMSLGFKKGDIVLWKGKLARVGGYLESKGTISLHTFDVDNKRFTQNAKPEDCIRLFNQRIMYTTIPLSSKDAELPCGRRL